ncbi:MAG TPA: response regulator transcription factor [Puia sp.]|nr:response regulator transcription factor [Puia sp.]
MRILLIGADGNLATVLAKGLRERLYDVDLAFATPAGECLPDWIRHRLIVVVHRYPDFNACEFCRAVRRQNAAMALLMLAAPAQCDVFGGFSAGVDDFIALPADTREIIVRVNALARRCSSDEYPGNRIRADDIIIDLDSKTVKRAGRAIDVTASEFKLLEYMIRNKNKVLSKEEIVCGVWGRDVEDKVRKLPVHMNNLRGKLAGGNQSGSAIYTVTRRGYLLADDDRPERKGLPPEKEGGITY